MVPSRFSNSGSFKIYQILDHSRTLTFQTIPEFLDFLHFRTFTTLTTLEFNISGPFNNFLFLAHLRNFDILEILEFSNFESFHKCHILGRLLFLFFYLDHFKIFTFLIIPNFSHCGLFHNFTSHYFIILHYGQYQYLTYVLFQNVHILAHSRIYKFWIYPKFSYSRSFEIFQILIIPEISHPKPFKKFHNINHAIFLTLIIPKQI